MTKISFSKTYELKSSAMIESIQYDGDLQILIVQFSNRNRYIYEGVPEDVVFEWTRAQSAGKFFNSKIKDRYVWSEKLILQKNPNASL